MWNQDELSETYKELAEIIDGFITSMHDMQKNNSPYLDTTLDKVRDLLNTAQYRVVEKFTDPEALILAKDFCDSARKSLSEFYAYRRK